MSWLTLSPRGATTTLSPRGRKGVGGENEARSTGSGGGERLEEISLGSKEEGSQDRFIPPMRGKALLHEVLLNQA